jgi:hypothetical protein
MDLACVEPPAVAIETTANPRAIRVVSIGDLGDRLGGQTEV